MVVWPATKDANDKAITEIVAINPSFPLSNTLAITKNEINPAINGSRGVTPSV